MPHMQVRQLVRFIYFHYVLLPNGSVFLLIEQNILRIIYKDQGSSLAAFGLIELICNIDYLYIYQQKHQEDKILVLR